MDFWRTALREKGPKELADQWQKTLQALNPAEARAALTGMLSRDEMEEAWHHAEAMDGEALQGIPFLVKDLFHVRGTPVGAGSLFLADVMERPRETNPLVRTLQEKGAVYAGKTQLNEFAYGLSGENPHYGDVFHPDFGDRLAGGSSSGSAWAVRKGLVPFALGTDTAGSIRVPAAFCGLFGFRHPRAEWSQEGCFPLSSRFDTAGWLTGKAVDMGHLIATLLPETTHPRVRVRPRIFGVLDFEIPMDPRLEIGYEVTANRLGAETDPETVAWFRHTLKGAAHTYVVLSSSDAWRNHQRWLDSHKNLYDPVVWSRLDQGRRWTAEDRKQAEAHREAIREAFEELFTEYDAIILPVTPTVAQPKDVLTADFRNNLLSLNTPVSLLRLPALSIPVFLESGLSGAIQVVFPNEVCAGIHEILQAME